MSVRRRARSTIESRWNPFVTVTSSKRWAATDGGGAAARSTAREERARADHNNGLPCGSMRAALRPGLGRSPEKVKREHHRAPNVIPCTDHERLLLPKAVKACSEDEQRLVVDDVAVVEDSRAYDANLQLVGGTLRGGNKSPQR